MAALDARDPRWVVTERADGKNVNSWHWTSRDVTELTRATLKVALEAPTLLGGASSLLQDCLLSNVAIRGDCSVNTRKGRKFLLCELDLRMNWKGELRGEGGEVERGAGTLHLPDVSPESLDDLEVVFTTETRGAPLSEAMRKEGVPAVRRAVHQCVRTLEEKMAAMEDPMPAAPPQLAAEDSHARAKLLRTRQRFGDATSSALAETQGMQLQRQRA